MSKIINHCKKCIHCSIPRNGRFFCKLYSVYVLVRDMIDICLDFNQAKDNNDLKEEETNDNR